MKYANILQPDLFDSKYAAEFVYDLSKVEIDTGSDLCSQALVDDMIPTDDMPRYIEYISNITQSDILKQLSQQHEGSVINIHPTFYAFYNFTRKPISMVIDSPAKPEHADQILTAGKTLAFATCAHAVFFRSIVMHDNGNIITNKDQIKNDTNYAIHIIGSTLRGNCLNQLIDIVEVAGDKSAVTFNVIQNSIVRDAEVNYKLSKFYSIQDAEEMEKVLSNVRKLQLKIAGQDDLQSRVLFASTLKALSLFGA